jgi:hypothetical protein
VILTSGGKLKWRRRRWAAERLRPVAEDASSTTELFDARRRARRATPSPDESNWSADESNRPPTGAGPHPSDVSAPLVRYEWRTASGESLVVEAAWPTTEHPSGIGVDTRANGNGEHHSGGHGIDASHVDLRHRAPSRPSSP